MKVYSLLGYSSLKACLEDIKQEELSYVDSPDYIIDEVDNITFTIGPKVDDEFNKRGIVAGACLPTGDISISMTHCKTLAGLSGLPLDTVVKFVLHHEDYHRRYDFNGGVDIEVILDSEVGEYQSGAESEINADLHSVKINGLSSDTYLKLRGAMKAYVENLWMKKVSPEYDNIERNVIKRLGASVED